MKVTYKQYRKKCGNQRCRKCKEGQGHGPYWYAYYSRGPRMRQFYLGVEKREFNDREIKIMRKDEKKMMSSKKAYALGCTLSQVRTGWFVSGDQAHKASDCHPAALRQAIKAHPRYAKPKEDVMKLMRARNLDESDRWFLLCEFPLQLFASKELAEASLGKEARR